MPRYIPTITPTALTGITEGTNYSIQNRTGRSVYVETAAAAPTDSGEAFLMESSGQLSAGIVKANSGESVYVWVADVGNGVGAVVWDEAP